MHEHVKIIAEVGSNFNGEIDTARDYIKAAKYCGCDAVKFQTLQKETLISPKIFQENKWVENPIWDLFSNIGLPEEWHLPLKTFSDENEIEFMSTPFYLEAVELLEAIDVKTYKVASGDITFTPLLETIGQTNKEVLLSTGASTLSEVEDAVQTLKNAGAHSIKLLHCVVSYPPQWEEMNLRAILTLKEKFNLPVGISDHTPGSTVPLASVALGATIIEKHLTFDRSQKGPDHSYAITVEEMKEMVAQVRALELALGSGLKEPSRSELDRRHRFRRGIYDSNSFENPAEGSSTIWLRPQIPD